MRLEFSLLYMKNVTCFGLHVVFSEKKKQAEKVTVGMSFSKYSFTILYWE